MKELMQVTKAISDENRVRLLIILKDGEVCACNLNKILGLAASTVSKHLSILKNAGLIDSRKEGRWIHYKLHETNTVAQSVLSWLLSNIKNKAIIESDRAELIKLKGVK